jgi:hypothetical protein
VRGDPVNIPVQAAKAAEKNPHPIEEIKIPH